MISSKIKTLVQSQVSLIRRSFQAHNFYQSRRYCQATAACWSCNATLSETGEIFCSSCRSIQKIPKIVSLAKFSMKCVISLMTFNFRIILIFLAFKSNSKSMQMNSRRNSGNFKIKFTRTSFQGRATRNKRWALSGVLW